MTYQELKALLRKHEESDPDTHLTAYITFSSFGPENTKEYPWEARTYVVSSNNKAFQPDKGGYSIFGKCLDGTDSCFRLGGVMKEEHSGKDGWIVEDCGIVGYLLIECSNYNVPLPKLFYSYSDALDCMLSRSAEKSGDNVEQVKKRYAATKKLFEGTYGCGWGTSCSEGPNVDWLWKIQPICIYGPMKVVFIEPENGSHFV